MHKNAIGSFVDYAKEEVQKKYGRPISYAKDCSILSEEITAITNRQISVTTLKRFFGIVESRFNPSKFTLDTLAIYLKFTNWQDFVNSFEKEKHTFAEEDSWDLLKKRARLITDYSLKSMRSSVGNQMTEFPLRQFATEKINAFFKSDKVATAFIAPEGHGKTLLITQLVDKYFTGPDPLCPQDVICLIDGRILVKLLSLNFKVNRIYNLLEFDPQNSVNNYFKNNPDEIKGRFILVIDSINEIFSQSDKLTHFVDNLLKIIASYEHMPWFKIIITCHPDSWQIFKHLMGKNPFLKTHWFDVSFENNIEDLKNIPLLNTDEIVSILKYNRYPQSLESIQFHYPEISDIISHPYFLHLFLEVQKTGKVHSDIDLLYEYIQHRILSDPIAVEKTKLIDGFLKACDNAKKSTSVNKEQIQLIADFEIAYIELLSAGILHEFKIPGSYLTVQTFIEFTHTILLEFFLANKWLKENELNLDLLKQVITFYDDNKALQCNIIKFIIKIAFKEEKTLFLKDIYSLFAVSAGKTPLIPGSAPYQEIINVIGLELRKNKKVRDILIPWYAKSKSGQLYYFESFFDMDSLVLHAGESLTYYLKYNKTEKAQIYGHFMKFMQAFLSMDIAGCEKEYHNTKAIAFSNGNKPLSTGLYHCAQIIYESVCHNQLSDELMADIFQNAAQLFTLGHQSTNSIPHYELSIVLALNYGDCFNQINKLSEQVFNRYELVKYRTSAYYQLFRAIYARALLNTGRAPEALSIFEKVRFHTIPVNTKQYLLLRYKLIQVEFLMHAQETEHALQLIDDIKSASKMLNFKYFYQAAKTLEEKLDHP